MKQQMKIRLLIDASMLGGVETHVINLCEGLTALHHDCQIIFVRDYPANVLYGICHDRGIAYQSYPTYSTLLKNLMAEKPDIIHTHGYKANIIGRLIGLISKSTIVSTFHAGEKPVGRLILYNFLDRWSGFFSHNICVNAAIASKLPSHAYLIPNFVSIPTMPNPLKIYEPYHIYFIGRFSPEKGPLKFCELSTLLAKNRFQFHMVGTGLLLAACEEKYPDNIQYHGACSNMDIVWPDVDLLCITSTYEGLPLVLLEAMSRGIPVVSFDVGSIKDTITDKEYVIEPFNLYRMSQCISSHFMLPLKIRKKMSQRARAKIISTFSSSVVIPEIEDVYKQYLP